MDWHDTLKRALGADPGAQVHLSSIEAAIRAGLAGRIAPDAVAAMGSEEALAALDRAVRSAAARSWDPGTLAAVRAVLRLLRRIESTLDVVAAGDPPYEPLADTLAELARAATAEVPGASPVAGEACPRCGHAPLLSRREKTLGDVHRVTVCPACGYGDDQVVETQGERYPRG